MKSSDLKEWLKLSNISRKELAQKCRVSKRTVDGWFFKDEIPEIAAALIERIMTDSIHMYLTIKEFNEITESMKRLNIASIDEFVKIAVAEKILRGKNKPNSTLK